MRVVTISLILQIIFIRDCFPIKNTVQIPSEIRTITKRGLTILTFNLYWEALKMSRKTKVSHTEKVRLLNEPGLLYED